MTAPSSSLLVPELPAVAAISEVSSHRDSNAARRDRRPSSVPFLVSLILLQCCCCAVLVGGATASRRYGLHHSYDGGRTYSPRGAVTLTVSSSEDGESPSIAVAASDEAEKEEEGGGGIEVDAEAMDAMISSSGGSSGMYRLKVVDDRTGLEAVGSVSGCALRRANFREEIGLTLNHAGDLLSVSYRPVVSALAPKDCASLRPLVAADGGEVDPQSSLPKFKTVKVTYSTASASPTIPTVLPQSKPPPGLKWLKRPSSGAGAGAGAADKLLHGDEQEKKGPQGFFFKYWYITVPLAIVGLFGGGPEPPESAAAEGQPQTREGAVPASASAAAGGGGGQQTVRRRGKRG